MKALCWHGTGDVRVDTVKDPSILDPTDIIIQILMADHSAAAHSVQGDSQVASPPVLA
jgi:hypothetical protein